MTNVTGLNCFYVSKHYYSKLLTSWYLTYCSKLSVLWNTMLWNGVLLILNSSIFVSKKFIPCLLNFCQLYSAFILWQDVKEWIYIMMNVKQICTIGWLFQCMLTLQLELDILFSPYWLLFYLCKETNEITATLQFREGDIMPLIHYLVSW